MPITNNYSNDPRRQQQPQAAAADRLEGLSQLNLNQQASAYHHASSSTPTTSKYAPSGAGQFDAVLAKFHQSEPHEMDMVASRVYLGSTAATYREDDLKRLGITHIMTVGETPLNKAAAFIKGAIHEKFTYMHMMLVDDQHLDLLSMLDESLDFIERGATAGGILVHCEDGMKLSVPIVLAYIMAKKKRSYDEAWSIVAQVRPDVNPNQGFRDQLKYYGKTLSCNVDPRSPLVRGHQLKLIAERVKDGVEFEQMIKPGMLAQVDEHEPGDIFCCKNCKHQLFNESHLVAHPGEDHRTPCNYRLYIEPMQWFADKLRNSTGGGGMLNCPGCQDIVGTYDWYGTKCNGCKQFVLPAFQLFPFQLEAHKH